MQFYKNLKRARVRMGKSQIEVAYIAYKGEVFELKDSQKRALLRELDNLFTKFEKSKVEDKNSKPKTYKHGNPHINRAGLASSAGSLAARRNIK